MSKVWDDLRVERAEGTDTALWLIMAAIGAFIMAESRWGYAWGVILLVVGWIKWSWHEKRADNDRG